MWYKIELTALITLNITKKSKSKVGIKWLWIFQQIKIESMHIGKYNWILNKIIIKIYIIKTDIEDWSSIFMKNIKSTLNQNLKKERDIHLWKTESLYKFGTF